jgi:hypothetical protein
MRYLPLVLLLIAGLAAPAGADDVAGLSPTSLTRAQLARLLPGGLSLGLRDPKIACAASGGAARARVQSLPEDLWCLHGRLFPGTPLTCA